jgi:hypothetical protein
VRRTQNRSSLVKPQEPTSTFSDVLAKRHNEKLAKIAKQKPADPPKPKKKKAE